MIRVPASVILITKKVLLPIGEVFLAILILLIGIVIAQLAKNIIQFILKKLQFDTALKAIKFNKMLEKAEIKKAPSEIVAEIVYWVSILVFILGMAAKLNLPIDNMLTKILDYSGLLFMAALILCIGTFLATFIGSIVYLIAANLGFAGAKPISRIIQYSTVVFTFILALKQLGIGPQLLAPSLGVIIGSVGLAAAIAFGLGCKDIMADFISNLIKGK